MIAIFCTTNSIENAKTIANALVEEELSACVNIIPNVLSIYKWENNIESDEEFLMVIKTKKELLSEIESKIKAMHPYKVPEIIAFDIQDGSKDYLNWLNACCK